MLAENQNNLNPYAAPLLIETPDDSPSDPQSHAAQIREQCRTKEADLKQNTMCLVGWLILISVIANLGAFGLLGKTPPLTLFVAAIFAAASTIAALTGLVVNWGVRRFACWSRIPLTMLAIVGLAAFPVGTAFGVGILLTLSSRQEPRLLSKEYEQIVKATPEMNGRTSPMTWLAIVLLVGHVKRDRLL